MHLTSPNVLALIAEVSTLRAQGARHRPTLRGTATCVTCCAGLSKRTTAVRASPSTEGANMPKRRLNPAFKRLLAREFPDMKLDDLIKLLDMGLLRLKRVRCAAWSRNPPRPCAAMALGNGLCRNHGGLSTRPSDAGRKRISEYQTARWAKWRAERGRPTEAP